MKAERSHSESVLEISNYPPPMCGWAIQTVMLHRELQRRGHPSTVMNINENRKKHSPDYVDVQNGWDYVFKLLRFALRGYRFHAHVNGESIDLYLLALIALVIGRSFGRPAVLTMHGGLPQTYFPHTRPRRWRWGFQLLFHLAGRLTCDSEEIKQAIVSYGIGANKIAAIACFSEELLVYRPVALPKQVEDFLASHSPAFLCYVSFRPEYRLPVLREAMMLIRRRHPRAGFIWLGFPEKEMPAARQYVSTWAEEEEESLLLLGNLTHDEFLTLGSRCFACIRTPACDGVSASVLEALALGVPVVASENGRRPKGVVTYAENDAADLCAKVFYLIDHYAEVKGNTRLDSAGNNTSRLADWLLASLPPQPGEAVHAR